MNRPLLLAAACVLGLSACSTRELNDAQLTQLLRRDGAAATDANAPLDTAAVTCLRVWSGDVELASGLPTGAGGDDAKNKCRLRLDGWLADATRNPGKFAFKDVSAPPTVRRAVALLAAHVPAPPLPSRSEPPAELTAARPPAPPPPSGQVAELGAPGLDLSRAESLCQRAQVVAQTQPPDSSLRRFADYCGGKLGDLRGSMLAYHAHNASAERMDALANDARNLANVAEQLIAEAQK